MYQIEIHEAQIGMVLVEPVIDEESKKLLVKAGQILNHNIIRKLIDWKVSVISVSDLHSLHINPIDKMQITLKDSYAKAIDLYSSMQISGNKRDDIPQIVKKMNKIIEAICKNEKVLNYCLEMRMVRERNLYEKAVHTSVFAGLFGWK